MKQFSIFCLLFILGKTLAAQGISVTGKITNENKDSVPFATVLIFSQKDTLHPVAEKIANEDGSFKLIVATKGKYIVNITHESYNDFTTEIVVDDAVTLNPILSTKKENQLGGVTVIAKKQFITRKLDRVVMNVQDNAATAGKSSLELFEMAPGVFVNNGNISINGVWGARVMVNGRMLNLKDADLKNYLQNLKSTDIKSMEIIPHPPAEYDAEGSGGIISIVMKKNAKSGLNGSIGADYSIGLGRYPVYNPSASLNYKKDKLGLSGSYSYNNEKYFQDVTQDRNFTNNGVYHSVSAAVQKENSNNVKLGATYDINEHQFLGIDYSGQFSNSNDSLASQTSIIYPNAINNSFSKGSFPNISKSNLSNIGINYSWATDTIGSKFELISDYTYNNKTASSGTNSQTYDANKTLIGDTIFNFRFPSISKIFTADAKYNKVFKSGTNLGFGGKITSTIINNNNAYDIFSGGAWNTSPSLAFNYKYKENIYAGFVNLSGTLLKTEYKLGFRGENSVVNGSLSGSQDTVIARNYFNLFPNFYLKRNLDKEGENFLSFSYNKRITRPSYSQLNPYKYFIDNYSLETGNPFLNPQFTNTFELGYNLGEYYVSASYSRTTDVINQVIINSPNNALMTILRENTGTNSVYTITISAPIKITKWWSSSNNLLLTSTKSIAPAFNIQKTSFIAQTEQDISFSKTFSMNLNAFYTPKVVQGNILTGRISSVDIGFQQKLFNNKLLAKAAISDIFYTNNFNASSYYNGSVINLAQKEQSRLLTLSLLYNFSLGKVFSQKKIEKSNVEEKSRL